MTALQTTLLAALAMALSAAAAAAPEADSATLRRIAGSGTIAVGFNESSLPFTYRTADGKVTGYSYDFALAIVDAVRRELKLPGLQVKEVVTTTQTRFPMVQNGAVDIQCGATTHTVERQKMVSFSSSIFVAGSRLMTRRDSGIKDFPDLTGKSVVTFARSTSEALLRRMNAERNARINVIATFDRGETPLAVLQAGQADAYMMDDVLLHAAVLEAWRPDEWIVTGKPQTFEAYGCILPRDDPAFKQVVDREIARMMKSGEAQAIYRKWMLSPIPPKGINLRLPMSEAMIELYRNPNDRPFE